MHEEAKNLNEDQSRLWTEPDEVDMITINTLNWNGERYMSEMETLCIYEREVLP
jgi:hypothetical protein